MFVSMAALGSLSAEVKVLAFAGSTREGSFNKKLVSEAADIARTMGASVTLIDLKDYPLPLYDADLEAQKGMPENAKKLRQMIKASHAIILASPEYNHSIPALLKNTIDWVSRNEQGGSCKEIFEGKRFALMSASPGKAGGARGLLHLKPIITYLGGVIVEPQVTLPEAHAYFSNSREENPLLKEAIKQLLNVVSK